MSIEAMKQALEALKKLYGVLTIEEIAPVDQAITALRTAIEQAEKQEPVCRYPRCSCNSKDWCDPARQQALDRKAENARELGLNYDPAGGTQVTKVWWDGDKLMAKPIPLSDLYTTPPEAPVQELEKGCHRSHPHENMDAMCKLRTEIARLTNENARLKAAAPVQELERLRDENERLHVENRRLIDRIETMGVPVGVGGFLTTTNAAQRQWVSLTDEEVRETISGVHIEPLFSYRHVARAIEAKLREKNGGQM